MYNAVQTWLKTKVFSVTAFSPNQPSINMSKTNAINTKVYQGRCLGSEISKPFSVVHGRLNKITIDPTIQIAPPSLLGNDFNMA